MILASYYLEHDFPAGPGQTNLTNDAIMGDEWLHQDR